MFMFGLKCFDDHARGDAQAITTYEDAMAYIEQQKSGMPQEEQQAFDRTIMDVILALNARDDAVRKARAVDDAARQAEAAGQKVLDNQDAGQHVDEGHDSMQPEPVYFHYPWKFVSAQLKNAKGDEIFYPVNDNRDREWARRLEWAIGKHRDIAEEDLDQLTEDYVDVIRQSKEAHERKYDQQHIASLYERLERANQRFRAHGLYTSMA
jgi:hypothetical protein